MFFATAGSVSPTVAWIFYGSLGLFIGVLVVRWMWLDYKKLGPDEGIALQIPQGFVLIRHFPTANKLQFRREGDPNEKSIFYNLKEDEWAEYKPEPPHLVECSIPPPQ